MSYNHSPAPQEEYPFSIQEQHLGTPASLESKLTIRLHIDALLGRIEDGTLELDEFGADGFECGIHDKEVAVGTEENIEGDGRDYCISIGEVLIGEMNRTDPSQGKAYDIYLDKQYILEPYGGFYMSERADILFQSKNEDAEDVSTEEIVEALKTERELDEETTEAVEGHYLVTEGEAQGLIRLLAEIVQAQS
jgi:hypothetical protein